eukprot:COSAG06_NODE_24_length_32981_cov_25.509671_9_plen_197_part_00
MADVCVVCVQHFMKIRSSAPPDEDDVKIAVEIDDAVQFSTCSVVVTDVSPTIKEGDISALTEVFSKYGRLLQIHLVEGQVSVEEDDQHLQSNGWALLTMSTPDAAKQILKDKNSAEMTIEGTQMRCSVVDHETASQTVHTWGFAWKESLKAAEAEVGRLLEPWGLGIHVPEELMDVQKWRNTVLAEGEQSGSKSKK